MVNKITKRDIKNLIRETLYRYLNEDAEPQASPSAAPFNMYLNRSNGKLYFNIEMMDTSKFGGMRNVGLDMRITMVLKKHPELRQNMQALVQMVMDDNKLAELLGNKKVYDFCTKIHHKTYRDKDSNLNQINLSTDIDNPKEILTPEGKINRESIDGKRVLVIIRNAVKAIGGDANMENEYFVKAMKMIHDFASTNYTKDMDKRISDDSMDLFLSICDEIGKGNATKLLNGMSIINDEGVLIDARFSFDNIVRIMAQAKRYDDTDSSANQLNTISYLATARQWNKMGRAVIDTTYKYWAPTWMGGRTDTNQARDTLNSMGQDLAVADDGKYDFRNERTANIYTNAILNPHRGGFAVGNAYYDVSVTTPIAGMKDTFTNGFGYSSNLTGEPNDYTKQRMNAEVDYGAEDENGESEKPNIEKNTVDILLNACEDVMKNSLKINVPNLMNDNDNINAKVANIKRYFAHMVTQVLQNQDENGARIARDDNYRPLIGIGVSILSSYFGLPSQLVGINRVFGDEEKAVLYKPIRWISNKILGKMNKLRNERDKAPKTVDDSINETLKMASPFIIFEETYNKIFNQLKEDASK